MAEKQTFTNVVIIEDNPALAQMLKEILTHTANCRSEVFNRGKLGVEYLEKLSAETPANLPDLVILDLGLPDGSGLGFLKQIKTHKKLAEIPVIVNTGSENLEDFAEAKQWDKVIFLKKGMGKFALGEIIAKLKSEGTIRS